MPISQFEDEHVVVSSPCQCRFEFVAEGGKSAQAVDDLLRRLSSLRDRCGSHLAS